MKLFMTILIALLLAVVLQRSIELKVDLSKEQVGRFPKAFQSIVGTWIVTQDGSDKVIMVDKQPWVTNKDNPTKLLIETTQKLYRTSNKKLMDNAKQFAYYPVTILNRTEN